MREVVGRPIWSDRELVGATAHHLTFTLIGPALGIVILPALLSVASALARAEPGFGMLDAYFTSFLLFAYACGVVPAGLTGVVSLPFGHFALSKYLPLAFLTGAAATGLVSYIPLVILLGPSPGEGNDYSAAYSGVAILALNGGLAAALCALFERVRLNRSTRPGKSEEKPRSGERG